MKLLQADMVAVVAAEEVEAAGSQRTYSTKHICCDSRAPRRTKLQNHKHESFGAEVHLGAFFLKPFEWALEVVGSCSKDSLLRGEY